MNQPEESVKTGEHVLHTFPVTASDEASAAGEESFKNEALDPLGVFAETKMGLDQAVRERAFQLWEQAGQPDGRADEFWYGAQHQRWSECAYALWEREGCPLGRADEHWYRTLNFERS